MEYLGLEIKTNSRVYPVAEDSLLAAELIESEIPKFGDGTAVIDMGCGTGILGLVAAKHPNVKSVVFADINEYAIELSRENAAENKDIIQAKCTFIKSDLFADIYGSFDFAIFNAPYLAENDKIQLSESWYGGRGGIEVSINFINAALKHIKDYGRILLVYSSLSDMDSLLKNFDDLGLNIEAQKKLHISFEDIIACVLKKE